MLKIQIFKRLEFGAWCLVRGKRMGFFDRFKNKFERAVRERRKEKVTVTETEKIKKVSVTTLAAVAKEAQTAHRALAHPLVTEKTAILAGAGKYVFKVSRSATKIDVKKAVEEVYGIRPVAVNIIRREGKEVRFGRILGQRKAYKKAMVTMPPGKTLPIYE